MPNDEKPKDEIAELADDLIGTLNGKPEALKRLSGKVAKAGVNEAIGLATGKVKRGKPLGFLNDMFGGGDDEAPPDSKIITTK